MLPDRHLVVVSYHDDDKTDLLRRCLLPLALGLDGSPSPCYLERHWLRGPHIRIVSHEPLGDTAVRSIQAYLRERPSTTMLDGDEYLRRSEELGRAELVPPPYWPVRPDNTVVTESLDGSDFRLLGTAGVQLKERYLSAMVPVLAVALDELANGRPRAALAFQALVLNASRWPVGGLATGQLSYRSHLEDYLANTEAGARVREWLNRQLTRVADGLRPLLRDVIEHAPHGSYDGEDEFLRSFSHALDTIWPLALTAAKERSISEDHADSYREVASSFDETTVRQWTFGPDRPSSEFHRQLGRLNVLPERVNAFEFAAYRHLTNLLTRWLPLLGTPPIERYAVSFAVSELVEEELGVSWRDQLAGFVAAATAGSDPERRP